MPVRLSVDMICGKFIYWGFKQCPILNGKLRGVPKFNFKMNSLFFSEASVEQFICTRVYKRHVR